MTFPTFIERISAALVLEITLVACSPSDNLVNAARDGNLPAVRAALATHVDPNSREDDSPAILFAAGNGHLDVVQTLIAAGANVNLANGPTGMTPLDQAAFSDHADVVRALTAAGADVSAGSSPGGTTAMQLAAFNGHADAVQALVDAGAPVNPGPNDGATAPLIWAIDGKSMATVQVLLKAGANPNLPAGPVFSPLAAAVFQKEDAIANLLRAYGAE